MTNAHSTKTFQEIEQFEVSLDRQLVRQGGGSQRNLRLQLTAGAAPLGKERPPVRVGFAVDRSGSMGGGKLELAAQAVIQAMDLLSDRDEFNVVFFDDAVLIAVAQTRATAGKRAEARIQCQRVQPGGSTNLSGGWAQSCAELGAAHQPGSLDLCILLTDGQANQGEIDPAVLCTHSQQMRHLGIVTTCIGIGDGFAEDLLKGMADAADGNFYFARDAAQLRAMMATEVGEALEVTAPGVAVEITPRGRGWLQALGSFRNRWTGKALRIELGDLCSGQFIDTAVQIRCPDGLVGEELYFDVALVGAEGQPLWPVQTAVLRYETDDQVKRQPRNRSVDQLVAQHHADRARMEAVGLNRRGDYAAAGQLLVKVAERIAGYAAGDAKLEELVHELRADAGRYEQVMDEFARKMDYAQSHNRSKTRLSDGSSTRARG